MKSPQALHLEIQSLYRQLQAHHNQIAYHKSGANLFAALFNPMVRKQSLQTVWSERKNILYILVQIRDAHEEQVVALFLECLQDEFSHLPDSLFLDTTTIRRHCVYDHVQYRSIQQKRLQLPLKPPPVESHDN